MKKFVLLFCMLITGMIAWAVKPPSSVVKAFEKKFPNATEVKWTKENGNEWEASFILEQVEVTANFSLSGKWLETETFIPVGELPEKVAQALHKSYKAWTITETYKIETPKPGLIFEIDIKKGLKSKEVLYKEDGKPYKK